MNNPDSPSELARSTAVTRRALLAGGLAAAGAVAYPSLASAASTALPQDGSAIPTFGPASLTAAIVTMTYHNGYAYVVTRGQSPAKLIEVDMATRRVSRVIDLPDSGIGSGDGAWASTVSGGRIYVGMYPDARVHCFDPATGEVTTVGRCGSTNTFVWSLATASDGMIFASTYGDGGVWQIDPATNTITELGSPVPAAPYGRFVGTFGDRWVFAGVYQPATLVRYDRYNGTFADVTPAEMRGGAWGPFASSANYLYTLVNGKVVRMDPETGEVIWTPQPPGIAMDGITVDSTDTVYTVGIQDGGLYRWVPGQGGLVKLLVPMQSDHRNLTMINDRHVLGGLSWGGLFTYDTTTSETHVISLLDAGFAGGAEPPQSIAVDNGLLCFGGHWGLQVHDTNTWETWRIPTQGELKTIDAIDGWIYAAIYTNTDLIRIDPRRRTVEVMNRIGNAQQRPWQSAYHAATNTLVIASAPGTGRLSGALTLWNLTTNQTQVFYNILPDQSVMSVYLDGDIAYISGDVKGGGNVTPKRASAAVAAFDVVQRKLLWMVEPVEGAPSTQSVATLGGDLYCVYREPAGHWFRYDMADRKIKASGRLAGYGRINVYRGRVYCSTNNGGQIYRLGPGLTEPKWLWTNLGDRWFTIPQIAPVPDPATGNRVAWTISDYNVTRVDLAE